MGVLGGEAFSYERGTPVPPQGSNRGSLSKVIKVNSWHEIKNHYFTANCFSQHEVFDLVPERTSERVPHVKPFGVTTGVPSP